MSYQVFARKWRPQRFDEIVGQEHVVKCLVNALQFNRLHHAYLFTGTRGVGKTTLARILAKTLNCPNQKEAVACGQCEVCKSVDEGRFLDLLEIDAASRTKVEDTRELLDNIQYAPHQGQYKIYLIDEVHMLSGHSFNALLKTLEEPPEHVKFLLATTDPQKIPVTVLSRCIQFNLKRLSPDEIFGQLEKILKHEQISQEPAALRLLAYAADGSMRDALSLLDQAIVHGDGQVTEEHVQQMLGTVARKPVLELLTCVAEQDAKKLIAKIEDLAQWTSNFENVLQQILQLLHRAALVQIVPSLLDQEPHQEAIKMLAKALSPEEIQLYYQIGLVGQGDMKLAPDYRSGFEMVMLRMLAFCPRQESKAESVEPVNKPESKKLLEKKSESKKEIATEIMQGSTGTATVGDWGEIIPALNLKGLTRELANHCVLDSMDGKSCRLVLDEGHKQLLSARIEEKLQQALQSFFGQPIKLLIEVGVSGMESPAVQKDLQTKETQKKAELAIEQDANVTALKKAFNAKVIPGSIEPIKK